MSSDAQRTNQTAVAPSPWLAIVGLGTAGEDALTPAAKRVIAAAPLVIGSARQLAEVASCVRGETMIWPSPLSDGIERLLARRGTETCVLASGDPFFYGIGATLAPHLTAGEFVCYPAPSSPSLAAACLGWPLQQVEVVSLHGRDLHGVVRYLQPGQRVIALSWDARTPPALASLLVERGFGASRMWVLEQLGGPRERVREARADAYALGDVDALNLVALELVAARDARVIPCRGSLPDSAFEHDGQLTKQDVRAFTLSALAPTAGALLWDVGAGAGSIAIEWLLAHERCRAIAIERDPVRAARIARNARALGVPSLQIVEAHAPDGLDALPTPDVIFIGGGGGNPALFERCWAALRSSGRLVVNAVSLETEAQLIHLHATYGGELRRISIESAGKLGAMTGWRPAMPVVQWRVSKQ